jgi:arginyl-tRNA synthetase
VRLRDLLDEAIDRARADLTTRLTEEHRSESSEYIDDVARTVGLGAVKYADLSQNRLSNYVFSFDKMLALQGNTAPYLIYAYVRVQGIGRKEAGAMAGEVRLSEPAELDLARHLLRLDEALDRTARDYQPNHLCAYLFELSQKFNTFYEACPILSADAPVKASRLTLADLTARTLKLGLGLLGIKTVERL